MSLAFNKKRIKTLAYKGKFIDILAYKGQIIYRRKKSFTMIYGNRSPYMYTNNFSISSGVSFDWKMGGIIFPKLVSGGNYTGCNGRSHGLGLQRRITLNCVDGYLRVSLGTSGVIQLNIPFDENYHDWRFYTNTTTGTPSTWYIEIDKKLVYSHSYGFNSGTSYINFCLWNWYTGSIGPSDAMRQALEYATLIRNGITVYDFVAVAEGEKPRGYEDIVNTAPSNTFFDKISNSYITTSNVNGAYNIGTFEIIKYER